jgi:hypothetical protein
MIIPLILFIAALSIAYAQDVPMAGIFLVFICGTLMFIAKASFYLIDQSDKKKKPNCPPHKWSMDTMDRMFCKECGNAPNYVSRDDHEKR